MNSNYSWTKTAETHGKYYSCCGATVEVENHVWVGGACSVCGYLHDHVGGQATCTSGAICVKCGSEYGQPDPTGHDPAAEWTQENDRHYHACKNGCGVHLDEAECSGEMPTCSKRSECQVCGNEFGELFPHNFCQYRERAATCTEDGQKGHRICTECQMILLLNGEEATQEGLVIPATGHDWGAPEWTWNEDGTTATVRFTCQNDGTHIEEPAVDMSHKVTTPATCTEAGEAVYTAKVTVEEQDYEDSRTVVLSALGHDATHVEAQAPTETEPGHKEYWACARCGLYFGDKELTAVLQPEDVVLPVTGKGDSGSGKGTPATGDGGSLALWAALLTLSGGAWLALRRKPREK